MHTVDHQRWSKGKFIAAASKIAEGKAICVLVNKGLSVEEPKDEEQAEEGHSQEWPKGLPKLIRKCTMDMLYVVSLVIVNTCYSNIMLNIN